MDLRLTLGSEVGASNPVEHDLHIDLGTIATVTAETAIGQHIRCRLKFFLGEWFLNLNEGIPYYASILVKNPDLKVVASILRRAILSVPGIKEIKELKLNYDASTRKLSPAFVCFLDTGAVERVGFGEFVITV